MLEAEDYKISLVLFPQSYEYDDSEIVYRIFVDNQLISERSLPVLRTNEALCDTFIVKLEKKPHMIFIQETCDKKLLIKKIIINHSTYNIFIKDISTVYTKDFAINVSIKKKK